ncbi:malonic semialdehyde reductase [Meridianimarinicoccus aquatilis]|uniref:Putative NADH dehydrogenase/NAD(P)H nitroreductase E2L05_20320 n=1 Tax=Meridianimarinicoccus aquatilis TaxID=2552766 RepID=A0A4R6AEN0_9RHOB|nr:malonic semialdehyde reductase [Fluviibacterium aquatile]TDL81414.1 malonic semialdehyde reductase [Fluviibacterium aquatile]
MSDTDTLDNEARSSAAAFQARGLLADETTLQLLFTEARTHYGWQDRDVSEDALRSLYDIAKMGPTSMNQQPMRVIFVRSDAAKDRLEPALFEGNRPKMRSAPVTAIIAYDLNFWEELPNTFPPNPDAQEIFKNNATAAQVNAFRNGTLQGAYFMLAARAVGLDVGGMSGFDNAKVDEEFFHGSSLKSNFLVNLGYADTSKIFRRLPRLDFETVCETI